MMAAFCGLPATAPFRSTRWMRSAPRPSQCRATASGSSEKTVSSARLPCLRRTQRPSFRSIAGINNMGFAAVISRPRLPVDEILVEAQSARRALLGVELCGENVILGYRAGKAQTVRCPSRFNGTVGGYDIVAVHEVKIVVLVDAGPDRMRLRLAAPGSNPCAALSGALARPRGLPGRSAPPGP